MEVIGKVPTGIAYQKVSRILLGLATRRCLVENGSKVTSICVYLGARVEKIYHNKKRSFGYLNCKLVLIMISFVDVIIHKVCNY